MNALVRRGSLVVGMTSVALVAPGACKARNATAIVLALDAEPQVTAQIDAVAVTVRRAAEPRFEQRYAVGKDVRFPGTLTLRLDDGFDASAPITIVVEGTSGPTLRTSRRARLAFVDEKTKLLRIRLSGACLDKDCASAGADLTCVDGACETIDVDPASLPDFVSTADALRPEDAGVASGGSSGASSGGAGGGGGGSGTAGGTSGSAGSGGGASGSGGGGAGGAPPSCRTLDATCGPAANADCCASVLVPAGTFHLGSQSGDADYLCDAGTTMCTANGLTQVADEEPGVMATISAFRLDVYEVTVARFRKFVDAVVGGYVPPAGSGTHAHLPGGALVGESGWDPSWSTTAILPTDKATWDGPDHLSCQPGFQTWTPDAGPNEASALDCVSWYQAYAFCIWDGGFLPTEAEWERAASGGEERVFPWSSPPASTTIDATYAVYSGSGGVARVGSKSPKGDGKWGHADLAGNVYEWALDWYVTPYPTSPCSDCASVSSGSLRVFRGGYFDDQPTELRATYRDGDVPANHFGHVGFRCARPPAGASGSPLRDTAHGTPG